MNYLSVCSGIEAATVAWHHMNWNPIGFSEIEKFPSEVLKHHYPTVTNYGDMTKYKEWQLNDSIGLLVGGTPCQSFSIAGLRKGLKDPRGNLMLTYLGIADHFKPKWILWENVPGVLSSNGGKDFACFLQGLAELGYGFAYRVLDAQHFGVPQRRRRVFVVGCFGDWKSAAKVLFESESLQRDITPSREKEKEDTGSFVPSIANCIQTTCHDWSRSDGFNMIVPPNRPVGAIDLKDTSKTLTASYGMGGADLDIKPLVLEPIAFDERNIHLWSNQNLNTFPTLTATDYKGAKGFCSNSVVRRLTPIECERLQGFPNNYTHIKDNCPDTRRYKALGNSMAVPVMKWIGERINVVSKS